MQAPERITFLFTDIEGSTRLLRELGDRYADVLAEHRRALREAFGARGGVASSGSSRARCSPARDSSPGGRPA